MKRIFLLLMLTFASRLCAQESALAADFRQEGERFQDSCGSFKLIGCGQLLFTDHPLHIAVGNLAPQNGFASGLALTTHYTPNEHWRLFMNADAVATPSGAWRAGAYLSAVLIRHEKIQVRTPTGASSGKISSLTIREMPVFHAYAQGISLNKLPYYGIGQGTSNNASFFGMTQTIAGGNAIWPIFDPLKLSLFGEANGRFFSIRGPGNQNEISIEQVNSEISAPGLLRQPNYAQFSQGVQLHPSFVSGHLRLNYAVTLQEWVATDSTYSFRRFKTDLSHQFPLYRTTRSFQPRQFNGPDTCAEDPNALKCPGISRNLEGSVELRFFYTTSYTSGGGLVPFYLDPTIGGSDINGTPLLPSLPDYRFRGPNLIAFRIAFEHSIYKWPIGVKLMLDQGKVGLRPGDLDFTHLAHSYAAGLTVRAGGLPVVDLLFAWGGGSTHTTLAVSPSLLGGTTRPSLF